MDDERGDGRETVEMVFHLEATVDDGGGALMSVGMDRR